MSDTTPERLALAKDDFNQGHQHLAALESKARNLMTIVSLLVGAGALAAQRGTRDGTLPQWLRLCVGLAALVQLASVAWAYRCLFKALAMRPFKGVPRALSTLEQHHGASAEELRESLAAGYAKAADDNRPVIDGVVQWLKRAERSTWVALWTFILAAGSFALIGSIIPIPEATDVTQQNNPGSDPKPSSTPPAPRPVETTTIEKGDKPK